MSTYKWATLHSAWLGGGIPRGSSRFHMQLKFDTNMNSQQLPPTKVQDNYAGISFGTKLPSAMPYLPFISLMACMKSCGSLKLTKPYPLVFLVCRSLITLAFWKVGYLEKARANVSSFTSLPRSPTNIRKSSMDNTRMYIKHINTVYTMHWLILPCKVWKGYKRVVHRLTR